ncbi:cysteine rich repeat-containing protein [Ancylobacter sp. MQZ15Z-1]|uniref:Cysteine rich repeat-containing protein n=1 Tax=Ancylobacter mangrovi TaxID=2972472 RepID=A0A9X2PDR4_9HYPH|nr:cysteine rich repeat-containing protein [Ancylobacter mangrovi]MCS0494100.1 cysteine rich repeat-containing protein [Ancylobacter mangrovi]
MRHSVMIGALLGGLVLAGSASAQDAMSPEMKQLFVQNCRQDLATYCSGVQPGNGAVKGCIRDNFRSFSQPCKSALRQMMAQRSQQQ